MSNLLAQDRINKRTRNGQDEEQANYQEDHKRHLFTGRGVEPCRLEPRANNDRIGHFSGKTVPELQPVPQAAFGASNRKRAVEPAHDGAAKQIVRAARAWQMHSSGLQTARSRIA